MKDAVGLLHHTLGQLRSAVSSALLVVVVGVIFVVALNARAQREIAAGNASGTTDLRDASFGTTSAVPATAASTDTPGDSVAPDASAGAPTDEPTPAKTSGPAPTRTPKPVVGTAPEGTPHYHFASGHVGDTIVNGEITIKIVSVPIPATFDIAMCAHNDPSNPSALAFEITESWTKWTSVDWTIEMGSAPFVGRFEDVPNYGNGVSNVVTLCHHPGDSTKIVIYSGPLEHTDVPEEYEWTIR